MALQDDLVDVALMVRGLRTPAEGKLRLPAIVAKLAQAERSVRRLKPGKRRLPQADSGLDWAYRSAMDAPISEADRAQVVAAIEAVKKLVGPADPESLWKPAPPPRRTARQGYG